MYSWPLKPFDQAHPVRGYFNDPRISGKSRAFHFGIDIAAPNGTPVYAVRAGVVHLEGQRSLSIADGDVDFGYWHVIPAVRHHERVAKHQLVGHVEAPWLHLHFAEHRSGVYRDPLRPSALTPWRDATRPQVTRLVFSRAGRVLAPAALSGAVDVIAEAHQLPPLSVPPPWDELPVTPARLRARPPRCPNRSAVAHPGRARQDPAPQRRVPPGLCAWHASEPLRPTWPLPLLPRPHLEYDVARRRRLPTRRRSDRPARQQGKPTAALHDRKQRLIPHVESVRRGLIRSRRLRSQRRGRNPICPGGRPGGDLDSVSQAVEKQASDTTPSVPDDDVSCKSKALPATKPTSTRPRRDGHLRTGYAGFACAPRAPGRGGLGQLDTASTHRHRPPRARLLEHVAPICPPRAPSQSRLQNSGRTLRGGASAHGSRARA